MQHKGLCTKHVGTCLLANMLSLLFLSYFFPHIDSIFAPGIYDEVFDMVMLNFLVVDFFFPSILIGLSIIFFS